MDQSDRWEQFLASVDKNLLEIDAHFQTLTSHGASSSRSPRRLRRAPPQSARSGWAGPGTSAHFSEDDPEVLPPLANYKSFPKRRNASARIFRPRRLEYAVFHHEHKIVPIIIGTNCE
jgi:hypothetical protein